MSIIFGIVGLLIVSAAIWVKREKNQDVLFVIGGICLLIYSLSIDSYIFVILQLVFIISSSLELVRLRRK